MREWWLFRSGPGRWLGSAAATLLGACTTAVAAGVMTVVVVGAVAIVVVGGAYTTLGSGLHVFDVRIEADARGGSAATAKHENGERETADRISFHVLSSLPADGRSLWLINAFLGHADASGRLAADDRSTLQGNDDELGGRHLEIAHVDVIREDRVGRDRVRVDH